MNQLNITVAPKVREELKVRAKQSFGSEQGWLETVVPGNESMVDSPDCTLPSTSLTVILGGGPVIECIAENCKVLVDHNLGAINPDLLSFQRKGNAIEIHAVVLDESGKVIAIVDKSRTHVNPNNAFEWSRPDASTIDVTDEYNRHVLHLHFANRHLVVIDGLFINSIGTKVVITKDDLTLSGRGLGIRFHGGCFRGGVAYSF